MRIRSKPSPPVTHHRLTLCALGERWSRTSRNNCCVSWMEGAQMGPNIHAIAAVAVRRRNGGWVWRPSVSFSACVLEGKRGERLTLDFPALGARGKGKREKRKKGGATSGRQRPARSDRSQGRLRKLGRGRTGGRLRRLRRNLDLYEVVLDCVHHQIANGVKTQLPHDVASVRFYRLGAQVQQAGNFFRAISFRQQLRNLALSSGQSRQLGSLVS